MKGTEERVDDAHAPAPSGSSTSSLRWSMLSRFISSKNPGLKVDGQIRKVSRRPAGRFDVVPCHPAVENGSGPEPDKLSSQTTRDVVLQYTIPTVPNVTLTLRQRQDAEIELKDFTASQKHNVDSTGLVCMWPSEEILTYFCTKRPELFRNKRVIELGSGYGLAGLAIAACTEASYVLLTDGNPQVVEYIEQNITANSNTFGNTEVRTCSLHWSRHQVAMPGLTYDVIVAADCTFFKDFHLDLAHTIKGLLGTSSGCQAIIFSPRRGDSLDRFVKTARCVQLNIDIVEQYDPHIWDLHQCFLSNQQESLLWPNYDVDHCYPFFLSITHCVPQSSAIQLH